MKTAKAGNAGHALSVLDRIFSDAALEKKDSLRRQPLREKDDRPADLVAEIEQLRRKIRELEERNERLRKEVEGR